MTLIKEITKAAIERGDLEGLERFINGNVIKEETDKQRARMLTEITDVLINHFKEEKMKQLKELTDFIEKHSPKTNYHIDDGIVVIDDDELNLSHNNLTTLPESIGQMKVNSLYLSYNKLTTLPESIGQMKVNRLDLYNNNLTTLPDSIGQMKVNNLYLYNNNLTSLPDSIGQMKVDNLDLSHNNLATLPDSIGQMKVNYLYLHNNNLTTLPESIGQMKVNRLDLYNNNLTTLPETRKFKRLEIGKDYIYCDGILREYHSSKKSGGITYYIGHFDVVAKKGKYTAHGIDLRSAKKDLDFKILSEKIKKEPITPDTIITDEKYHIYTGACELGISEWKKQKGITAKKMKAKDLLPILRRTNAYGLDKFEKLLK